VALDYDRLRAAVALARRLRGAVGLLKIGSQLYTAEGPRAIDRLAGFGFEIFLDLKFHDIPNTVAGAVAAAADLRAVTMLTLHASGGLGMLRAAREALTGKRTRPALLAVTLLTSLNPAAMREIGIAGTPAVRALALAKLAKEAGMDGVVASAHEARVIRRACGPKFLIVVPGVRPAAADANDQSRVATPAEAVRAGADYLVLGRPITAAPDPRAAAIAIAKELETAPRQAPKR
jgi:orotidine-5'-phosphate decarboxylase